MNKLTYLLLSLILAGATYATELPYTTSKRIVTLGDVISYKFALPKTNKLPYSFKMSSSNAIIYVSSNIQTNKNEANLFFTSFELGTQIIPTIELSMGTENFILRSQTINVISAFPQAVSRNFILNLKSQEKIVLKWWNYLIILIGLAIAIYYLYKILNKLANGEPIIAAKIVTVNPYEQAIKKLAKIETQQLWIHNLKEYYFELSFVFKEYLELSLKLNILEKTTSEIKNDLPDNLSKQIKVAIYNFLTSLDPVKYSQYEPSVNEAHGKITQCLQLITKINELLFTPIDKGDRAHEL